MDFAFNATSTVLVVGMKSIWVLAIVDGKCTVFDGNALTGECDDALHDKFIMHAG